MKGLSLIIGNSEYENPSLNLKNAKNDAQDFSAKLRSLGFITKCFVNISQQQMDEEIIKFADELDNFDIGIFYYAGHGMQIEGENFISATNTNFEKEISAQYSSITLNKVLAYMDKAKNDTNIIILDACRDNPFEKSWHRSIKNQGLAPMYAPKGTLIAYATSPGEKASDGSGRNGLYTSALLKHIDDKKITIEEFFKRVRNSVYAFSSGKQTSWEHTSLTGTFVFNSGSMIQTSSDLYHESSIKDSTFETNTSEISQIIKKLKSHNWYTQSPAITSIPSIKITNATKDELFVLGRNFLQTADGGENQANNYMANLDDFVSIFNEVDGSNHFLNGMLFEIFFDSEGTFRDKYLKNSLLHQVNNLSVHEKYKKSFEFIEEQLIPFSDILFFLPKPNSKSINLDLIFEKSTEKEESIYMVKDILHEGKSIIKTDARFSHFSWGNEPNYEPILYNYLKKRIADLASVPLNYLSLTSSYDSELNVNSKIMFPYGIKLEKH